MTETTEATAAPSTLQLVEAGATAAGACGREDLADRLRAAATRVRQPSTVACVVGEFKQGKSSLVNALLTRNVCPVDDDLATSAVTVIRHGAEAAITVHRRSDEGSVAEVIPAAELSAWVSETGNPDNVRGVERVEIQLPHPLLEAGLTVVDTPGMGGLGSGTAAATLAFLPHADVLLFASDASAELSAPEVAFLQRARESCPTTVFCLTKTDLYPEWRRIRDLDAGHLARAGVAATTVPLSSSLRGVAFGRRDKALDEESGFPALLNVLYDDVFVPAQAAAAAGAIAETANVLGQLMDGYRTEHDLLVNDSARAETVHQLQVMKERLENLRGPASRWSIVLGDRMGELGSDANHRFRAALRRIGRTMDERVEALTKADEWAAMSRDFQTDVAEAVAAAFAYIDEQAADIQREILELLQEDAQGIQAMHTRARSVDPLGLWTDRAIEQVSGNKVGRGIGEAWGLVRGAQGGLLTFGMLGQLLPAAAAALLMSNPVMLGFGVIFGRSVYREQRKRKVAARQQQAQKAVRQFLDEVQFEVGNNVSETLRDMQRQLRDHFQARMAELQRTTTETLHNLQADGERSEAARAARSQELQTRMASLQTIADLVAAHTP